MWNKKTVAVLAPGPSLSADIADQVFCATKPANIKTICVNDAHRLCPWSDILYGADNDWWRFYDGVQDFQGVRLATAQHVGEPMWTYANQAGIDIIPGCCGETFSLAWPLIHYGHNSGFQAVNVAIHLGGDPIILIGFDMQGSHFFGHHPRGLNARSDYSPFLAAFNQAAESLPPNINIINCTPGSRLKCFPFGDLADYLCPA